jgi:hypothetical protein
MGSLARYACCKKEMLGWIREKMAIQKSAPGGGRFFASNSTVVGNGALACNNPCSIGEDCSTVIGNGSWDNAHTSDLSSKGERLGGEPSTLVQRAQRMVGAQMAKLVVLQLVQSIGARSTMKGPINQEAGAPPFPGFPHTMLSVKMVKDNMQLAFIEKFSTNREIRTNL